MTYEWVVLDAHRSYHHLVHQCLNLSISAALKNGSTRGPTTRMNWITTIRHRFASAGRGDLRLHDYPQ